MNLEQVVDLPVLMTKKNMVASCAEARRLINMGEVSINNKQVDSHFISASEMSNASFITIGKHKIFQL